MAVKLQYVSGNGSGEKRFIEVSPNHRPNGDSNGYYQLLLTEEMKGSVMQPKQGITVHLVCSLRGTPLTPFYIGRNGSGLTANFAAEKAVEVTVQRRERQMRNHHLTTSAVVLRIVRHSTNYLSGGHEVEALFSPIKISVLRSFETQIGGLLAKLPPSCAHFQSVVALAWDKTFNPHRVLFAHLKDEQKDPRPDQIRNLIQALR